MFFSFVPAVLFRLLTCLIAVGVQILGGNLGSSDCLLGLCVILYVLIWTIPNQMLGYPCFSLMGLVLGIMYPATLALSNLCLPHEFHMVAMAMM
jgi:hypothetical protein